MTVYQMESQADDILPSHIAIFIIIVFERETAALLGNRTFPMSTALVEQLSGTEKPQVGSQSCDSMTRYRTDVSGGKPTVS